MRFASAARTEGPYVSPSIVIKQKRENRRHAFGDGRESVAQSARSSGCRAAQKPAKSALACGGPAAFENAPGESDASPSGSRRSTTSLPAFQTFQTGKARLLDRHPPATP